MERKSQIELTNLCLVCDGTRILVEEKRGTSYPGGLIFPGGPVEKDDSLRDSVIREIKEETGLTLRNPKLCGVKDWIEKDGTRYLVLLYKTSQFEGELKSSEEGRVFWLDRKEVPQANLIWNMRELLEIFDTEGKKQGFVVGVSNNGANDLLSVKTNSKKIVLIPFVKAIVTDVSIKDKKIIINNLEGLLE